MGWVVSKLNVDFESEGVTVGIESTPIPGQTILLNFRAPDNESLAKLGPGRAAQALDDASRRALLARAKQILTDAANSL